MAAGRSRSWAGPTGPGRGRHRRWPCIPGGFGPSSRAQPSQRQRSGKGQATWKAWPSPWRWYSRISTPSGKSSSMVTLAVAMWLPWQVPRAENATGIAYAAHGEVIKRAGFAAAFHPETEESNPVQFRLFGLQPGVIADGPPDFGNGRKSNGSSIPAAGHLADMLLPAASRFSSSCCRKRPMWTRSNGRGGFDTPMRRGAGRWIPRLALARYLPPPKAATRTPIARAKLRKERQRHG